MGKFNPQPWNLEDESQYDKIANDIMKIIEDHGFDDGDQIVYGSTAVSIHKDGTATLRIATNGKVFVHKLQLYPEGVWEILE